MLAWIEREHCAELNLCNLLEKIADHLLEPLDRELANTGILTLRHCVKRHVALEEGYLYPVLARRAGRDELTEAMLVQIRGEHAVDECLAHDTADQLELALTRGHVEKPEMLGYMLRGFFECRRRHIAWEDAIVLPLARRLLAEEDFHDFSAEAFEEGAGAGNFFEFSPRAKCGCGCGHGS
ncbi:hypothetical protein BMS3Bbin10_02231 [bacterium BMS3Bbin10]|nr:hypothetical protein BMS3Bbin10_02231 [bacterium BMS3Bbin10]